MKKLCMHVLLVTSLLVVSTRCGTEANLLKAGSPLISSLSTVPELSSITSLLQTPGLDKALGGAMKDPFTLLAPTNDAVNSLGADAMSTLTNPANLTQLANLLKNHIVKGKVDAAGLMQEGLKAVSGTALNLANAKLGNLIAGDKFNIVPVDKLFN